MTLREHEILVHVIAGTLNKQIAYNLDMSENTVKMHRARIMRKMEVESLAELVRATEKAGLNPSLKTLNKSKAACCNYSLISGNQSFAMLPLKSFCDYRAATISYLYLPPFKYIFPSDKLYQQFGIFLKIGVYTQVPDGGNSFFGAGKLVHICKVDKLVKTSVSMDK